MIDATVLARHKAITGRGHYDPSVRYWDGWKLSSMGDATHVGSLPPALRGDLLREYEDRRDRTTVKAATAVADPLAIGGYEANIARRLGWRSRNGFPSFVYWRHIPLMRLEQNGDTPHIFISAYHAGGKAQATRALMASNNMLDYLMTGVRLSAKGVSLAWRHEETPWPKTLRKPGVYIPVLGDHRKTGKPFWTARTFEFVEPGPLCFVGGTAYEPVRPFPLPAARPADDDLEGLV